MGGRWKVWIAVAVVFVAINAVGGVWAAAQGEPRHAELHVVLALVGVIATAWLAARRSPARLGQASADVLPAVSPELGNRLSQLEQSVEAVAIEVERIGEGQRFMTRLVTERDAPAPVEKASPPPPSRPREE